MFGPVERSGGQGENYRSLAESEMASNPKDAASPPKKKKGVFIINKIVLFKLQSVLNEI